MYAIKSLKRDIAGLAGIYPAYDFCSPTTCDRGETGSLETAPTATQSG